MERATAAAAFAHFEHLVAFFPFDATLWYLDLGYRESFGRLLLRELGRLLLKFVPLVLLKIVKDPSSAGHFALLRTLVRGTQAIWPCALL